MAQTAAHLVDHVIPHVPVRQWVLALPSLATLTARFGFERQHTLRQLFATELRGLGLHE